MYRIVVQQLDILASSFAIDIGAADALAGVDLAFPHQLDMGKKKIRLAISLNPSPIVIEIQENERMNALFWHCCICELNVCCCCVCVYKESRRNNSFVLCLNVVRERKKNL